MFDNTMYDTLKQFVVCHIVEARNHSVTSEIVVFN